MLLTVQQSGASSMPSVIFFEGIGLGGLESSHWNINFKTQTIKIIDKILTILVRYSRNIFPEYLIKIILEMMPQLVKSDQIGEKWN